MGQCVPVCECKCVWYQSLFCVSQTNWIKILTKIYVALPAAEVEAEANPDHLKVNWELYDFRSRTLSLFNLYDCDCDKVWFRWVHEFLSGIKDTRMRISYNESLFEFVLHFGLQQQNNANIMGFFDSNLDQKVNDTQIHSGYATELPHQIWHHHFLEFLKVKEVELFYFWCLRNKHLLNLTLLLSSSAFYDILLRHLPCLFLN